MFLTAPPSLTVLGKAQMQIMEGLTHDLEEIRQTFYLDVFGCSVASVDARRKAISSKALDRIQGPQQFVNCSGKLQFETAVCLICLQYTVRFEIVPVQFSPV